MVEVKAEGRDQKVGGKRKKAEGREQRLENRV
jgi:hypothetical protein